MNQNPIIAHARPKEILVKESYIFYSNYGSNSPKGKNSGSGKIEIKVPLDGKTCVNQTTIEDLQNQRKRFIYREKANARIGYIGFVDFENTDLDEKYALSAQHNILPLELWIKGIELPDLEDLTKDSIEQVTTLNYSPVELHNSPIFFNRIEITDEYELKHESNRKNSIKDFILESWEKYNNKLVSFHPTMVLTFILSFNIPIQLQSFIQDSKITITDMSIEWPVATSISHVNVYIQSPKYHLPELGEPRDLKYDPHQQWIRWGNIPFEPKKQNDGSCKFITPEIRLSVREPGELFEINNLLGELTVNFSSLLSNLKLAFFDAEGKQNKSISPKYSTEIKVHFNFSLRDLLGEKIFTPYQIIQFPKVILNRMRLNDILTLLRDERFSIFSKTNNFPEEKVGKEVINFSIYAVRNEGEADLILILDLEGRPSTTEREKEIPEGEKFKSTFTTGETTCRIRGWFPNDSQLIVQEINRIHSMLKHRFHHVSVLD